MLKFFKILPTDKRPETIDAIEEIVERYLLGELSCSINIPPRWGKSTIIRGAALELQEFGVQSIVLAPWEFLSNQIKERSEIELMYNRYQIIPTAKFYAHRCSKRLIHHKWFELSDGTRPTLTSMTLGLATSPSSRAQFLSGIDVLHEECQKRIPVFIDECHLARLGKDKSWGPFVLEVQDAGGYIIVLTGTAVLGIPGFKEDAEEWYETTRRLVRRKKVEDEIKTYLETYDQKVCKVTQEADVHIPWQKAFDVGALALANPIWNDFDVYDHTDSSKIIGKLSSLDLKGLQLKSILEGEEATTKMAACGVARLLARRNRHDQSNTQMMIMTGYDQNEREEKNFHARQYKKAITNSLIAEGKEPRNFRIEIATGVDDWGNPDEDSLKKINEFREGKIDILIVKMMGMVGLDCPSLKILVFAGTIRRGPMLGQALTRPLTEWLDFNADLILPRDKDMVKGFNSLIANQGGLARTESVLVNIEEIETTIEKPPEYNAKNGTIWGYSDLTGEEVEGDYELKLRLIKKKYVTGNLTDVQIIKNHNLGGFPLSPEEFREATTPSERGPHIKDLDEDLEDVEGAFGKEAKTIVSRYIDYGMHPKEWVEKVRQLGVAAKKKCRVYMEVSDIDDAELLKKLIAALDTVESQVFEGMKRFK